MPIRKTIGRPPLLQGDVKESRLYCRLLKSEELEIESAAKEAGKTKSEWIRQTLVDAARSARPKSGISQTVVPDEEFLD